MVVGLLNSKKVSFSSMYVLIILLAQRAFKQGNEAFNPPIFKFTGLNLMLILKSIANYDNCINKFLVKTCYVIQHQLFHLFYCVVGKN